MKDARLDYDYAELATRALSDKLLAQINFDDSLASQLTLNLAGAEAKAVEAVRGTMAGLGYVRSAFVPPYMTGLVADDLLGASLSNRTRVFARQLSDYAKVAPRDPLMEYLGATGGLLNVANRRPLDRYYAEAARLDAANQVLLLGDLKTQLNDIASTLANIDIREEGRQRQAALADLRQRIDAVTKAAAENQGAGWAARFLTALGEAGKSAGAMYAAYQTGSAAALVTSAGQFVANMDTVRNIWAANGTGGEALPALREEMQRLQASYVQFLAAAAQARQAYADARLQALEGLLRSRVSGASRMDARHAQFNDLLRMAVISNLADPARSARILDSNFDSLQVFLTSFPRIEPFIQFRDVDFQCRYSRTVTGDYVVDPGCVEVAASSRPHVLLTTFGDSPTKIPLYVIAPRRTALALPTFGLRTTLEEDHSGYAGERPAPRDTKEVIAREQSRLLLDVPFP